MTKDAVARAVYARVLTEGETGGGQSTVRVTDLKVEALLSREEDEVELPWSGFARPPRNDNGYDVKLCPLFHEALYGEERAQVSSGRGAPTLRTEGCSHEVLWCRPI